MRIDLGNFGNSRVQPAPAADVSAIGAAVRGLGQTAMAGAEQMHAADVAQRHKAEAEMRANATLEATNALNDNQLQVEMIHNDIASRLADGSLAWDKARTEYDQKVAKLKLSPISSLDRVTGQGLVNGIRRLQLKASMSMDSTIAVARRQSGETLLDQNIDTIGKLADSPDADIEALNGRLDQLGPLVAEHGVAADRIAGKIQTAKDRNWFNQARSRLLAADNDRNALQALHADLTAKDGYYSQKLDAGNKLTLQASVQTQIDRIDAKTEIAAARKEATAERAIAAMDRQTATGVPATAAMWSEWRSKVQGTSLEGEFRGRVRAEQEVQSVLRKPIAEQVAFVQQRQAQLDQTGGDLAAVANLSRLRNAVQANVKMMTEAPLEWAAARQGETVQPINLTMIADQAGARLVADQLKARADLLAGVQKQGGAAVQLRPLLAGEAQQLGATLRDSTPKQAADILGAFRQAAGDDEIYRAALSQVAPDAPVTALAGMLASRQSQLTTTATHWFRPDDVVTSRDVARTMLEGEALLNPSKAAKAQDGKPRTGLFLPETTTLQERFATAVGNAFAGRPAAADIAFQAAQAYYVGKAAATGRLATDRQAIDQDLVQEAVTATLGTPVNFNGKGTVLAPWGMSESDFTDRVGVQFRALVASGRLAVTSPDQLKHIGLVNDGDSTYRVTVGRNLLVDEKGRPVIVDVAK